MRLLFDENLSPRLCRLLTDVYPDSVHVRDVDLRGVADEAIWLHAQANELVVVSKDNDFRQRSFLRGAPPKIIWLDVSNAGTTAIAQLLRHEQSRILAFEREHETSLLIVSSLRDSGLER